MIDTHELAWAAGFFDGEGHIRYKRGDRHNERTRYTWKNILLEVAQKDRRSLDRLQKALGCGKVYGPYRNGAIGSNKEHYAYRFCLCGFYDIKAAIDAIWPWLGEIKREQASIAINGWINEPRLRLGRKSHPRIIPTCHPEKPHKALTLCNTCYRRRWRENKRRSADVI